MRVEYQTVEPDVVITLSKSEARDLKRFIGLGVMDLMPQHREGARESWPSRHLLYDALSAKGV